MSVKGILLFSHPFIHFNLYMQITILYLDQIKLYSSKFESFSIKITCLIDHLSLNWNKNNSRNIQSLHVLTPALDCMFDLQVALCN